MEIDGRRGTPLWAINQFRADALTQLLHDLMRLESIGLPNEDCKRVKNALGELVNIATAIPDKIFLGTPIWKHMQEFADVYEKWNSHEGTDPEFVRRRNKELRRLRAHRNKLATRIRNNNFILSQNLDLATVKAMYDTLQELTRAIPNAFSALAKAIERFLRGLNGLGN